MGQRSQASGVKPSELAQGPGVEARDEGHGAAGIARLLDDREWTHGNFTMGAAIAQALKDVIRGSEGYARLSAVQREALDQDCSKTARILAGNPNYPDHWKDKAGYPTLVAAELEEAAAELAANPSVLVDLALR